VGDEGVGGGAGVGEDGLILSRALAIFTIAAPIAAPPEPRALFLLEIESISKPCFCTVASVTLV
jgi:hypothetical protein